MRAIDPELVEGVHYSIVFYGGSVLAQFDADDPEVTELVSLLAVNRSPALIADSDLKKAGDEPGGTKREIEEKLKGRGFYWQTAGREIENYIPPSQLKAGIQKTMPQTAVPRMKDDFGDWLPKNAKKVKIAQSVVTSFAADLTRLDLRTKLTKLLAFIRDANHLSPLPDAPLAT